MFCVFGGAVVSRCVVWRGGVGGCSTLLSGKVAWGAVVGLVRAQVVIN